MRSSLVALFVLILLAAPSSAGDELKVGSVAPDFTGKDQDGNDVRLKDFRGKHNVALAFFPRSFTGG